jgi:signal transduction histidine kinase
MNAIIGFSEILVERLEERLEPKYVGFLRSILQSGQHLLSIINDILDLSKLESGTTEWNETIVDMREVVETSVSATSELFREKDVRVETDIEPGLPTLLADADRVLQVLYNLLSNAVKFCAQGKGRVRIRVFAEGEFVRVDVRDNGPGISARDQRIIFDKFRQAKTGGPGRPRGTGLGLHISYRIVEHFGGRIWVASRPGAGATFSFTLPRRRTRMAA